MKYLISFVKEIFILMFIIIHIKIYLMKLACKEKELPEFDGEVLDKRPTLGNLLLKFIFPNFHLVDCKGVKDNSLYARFADDHKLWRTIEYCLKFKPKIKTPVTSRSLAMGLEMIGGNIPTSYLPMKVKMLLDYYMPKGGNYFDFSCGFGGRLLGSQCVTNGKINYYGLEPNTETFYHLNELKEYIKEALGGDNEIHLYQQGSEVELPKEIVGNIDFAFSCPPYFNLEQYSNEQTQCYIKYPTLDLWLDGYVKETIKNLYKALKPNAYYAVQISDFKVNGQKNVEFVKEWLKLSEENGFKLEKTILTKTGKSRPTSNTDTQDTYFF